MIALGAAVIVWLVSAITVFVARRWRGAAALGAAGSVLGGGMAAYAAIGALGSTRAERWTTPWSLPGGELALRLDPLGAAFLLPLAIVGALCAVYGIEYLKGHAHGGTVGGAFAGFNLLLASMAVVVAADDILLLVIAWELMTLSSWALVVSDHDAAEVRAAGVQYLVAGHLATIALLLLGLLLAGASGTFAISGLSLPAAVATSTKLPATLLFLLALVGFGTKAGIVPMHVWLPDAHPAAPSHVSALMSAVMITMGFYGLARFIPILGEPAVWWGYLLMALGAAGAMSGMAFGIAQRDVKRTLAYSTVENAGIVTLAMGVGVMATALHEPRIAGIAWTAALLHVWNHALAKALLFLGFGAIAQGVGSRSLDAMGGLLRRWRVLAAALVLGAAALASLPGLNLFTSEWLLLRGLFMGALVLHGGAQVATIGAVVALALTGGIAVASFTRLVGLGLLGAPRTSASVSAPEPGWLIRAPLVVFAAGCVAIAAVPQRTSVALEGAVSVIAPAADLGAVATVLQPLAFLLPLLVGLAIVLLVVRASMQRLTLRRAGPTWGCGFPSPTSRMQYTSTSFGEPLTRVLQPVLHTTIAATSAVRAGGDHGGILWPVRSDWASTTADRVLTGTYLPVVDAVRAAAQRIRGLHSPRVSRSLLYVVATVLVLVALLFRPGFGR